MIPSDDDHQAHRPWGDATRWYTAERHEVYAQDKQDEEDPALKRLRYVLSTIDGKLKDQVDGWVRKWNQVLRESMRNQTALRLSVGDDRASVPIRVTDGMPAPLRKLLAERKDDELRLLLRMPLIIQARDGARFVAETEIIPQGSLAWLAAKRDGLTQSQEVFHRIIQEIGLKELLNRVAGIHEDILGAYYFRIPEIRIHWMSIGFVSSILGVDPEALTMVTLAHELAHAYTHKGQDIDGKRWDNGNSFAASELCVVEGLAQFFTAQCCKDMSTRHPLAVSTYETLLNNQSAAYQIHTEWVSDRQSSGSEIVRFSMLECRSLAQVEHHHLAVALAENRTRLLRLKPLNYLDSNDYSRIFDGFMAALANRQDGLTRKELCSLLLLDDDAWWQIVLDLMASNLIRRQRDGDQVRYVATRKNSP